ncbi:putative transcriptional regulator (plasmid) [Fischerella sp. NIES-4106]|nr:putative transcriptional regulator [Fischerella sp. NIES-4106]
MTVRLKIKSLREGKYTQRQMADFLGVTETNYRRLENNQLQSVTFEALDKLCKVFECTPDELLDYVND